MNGVAELDELIPAIPAQYQRARQPEQSMRARDGLQRDSLYPRIHPLWDLEVEGRVVRPAIPIGVRLREEEGHFFAENDSLGVYATGGSPEDAVADFRATAAFFVAEYRSLGPDQVIGLGARLRETFQRVFPL